MSSGRIAEEDRGPGERNAFPEKLTGHVVKPGDVPLLHGFDVQGDLAKNFRYGEVLLLTLTGEEPTPVMGRGFEVALTFFAPRSVAEAPVHAAVLAKLCECPPSVTLGAGAVALAQAAEEFVGQHQALLEWLQEQDPARPLPGSFGSASDKDKRAVDRLYSALPDSLVVNRTVRERGTLSAALVSILWTCGLRKRWQLEAALCTAGMGAMCAEAARVGAGDFGSYPLNLPEYAYRPDNKDRTDGRVE